MGEVQENLDHHHALTLRGVKVRDQERRLRKEHHGVSKGGTVRHTQEPLKEGRGLSLVVSSQLSQREHVLLHINPFMLATAKSNSGEILQMKACLGKDLKNNC